MSIPVDLESLPDEIERFGANALLVSNSPEGPPHVSSVIVTVEGGNLTMGAGRRTRTNTRQRPEVTLVWTSAEVTEHCLIVDGTALAQPAEHLIVKPTSAVLHRLAAAEG